MDMTDTMTEPISTGNLDQYGSAQPPWSRPPTSLTSDNPRGLPDVLCMQVLVDDDSIVDLESGLCGEFGGGRRRSPTMMKLGLVFWVSPIVEQRSGSFVGADKVKNSAREAASLRYPPQKMLSIMS